jgi:hypothetical protein
MLNILLYFLKCLNYLTSSNNINCRGINFVLDKLIAKKEESKIRNTEKNKLAWTAYQCFKNINVASKKLSNVSQ